MIVREFLEPLFESIGLVEPYEYRRGKFDKLACFYYFETEDGDKYVVRFMNLGEIHNRKKQIWQTEFVIPGKEGNTAVVNKGRVFKVLSTIIHIIQEFLNEDLIQVDGLNINPASSYKGDTRRYDLYLNYINKLLPEFPNWKKAWNPFDKRILLRKKT
jgi:hypothetical protein